jgi:hypothetical protein
MVSDDDLAPYQGVALPTRRQFLRGLLGVGTVAGTVGVASQVRFGSVEARRPRPDTWPRPGFDAARSSFNPAASPPTDPAVDWRRPAPKGSTFRRVLVAGTDAVYAGGDRLRAFGRADGRELWQGGGLISALALGDGRLYAGAEGLNTLRALTTAGEQQWEVDTRRQRILDILPAGERLFVGRGGGVAARDPSDGTELWWADRGWGRNFSSPGDGCTPGDPTRGSSPRGRCWTGCSRGPRGSPGKHRAGWGASSGPAPGSSSAAARTGRGGSRRCWTPTTPRGSAAGRPGRGRGWTVRVPSSRHR